MEEPRSFLVKSWKSQEIPGITGNPQQRPADPHGLPAPPLRLRAPSSRGRNWAFEEITVGKSVLRATPLPTASPIFTDVLPMCYRFFGLSWETSTIKNYHSQDSGDSGSRRIEFSSKSTTFLMQQFLQRSNENIGGMRPEYLERARRLERALCKRLRAPRSRHVASKHTLKHFNRQLMIDFFFVTVSQNGTFYFPDPRGSSRTLGDPP